MELAGNRNMSGSVILLTWANADPRPVGHGADGPTGRLENAKAKKAVAKRAAAREAAGRAGDRIVAPTAGPGTTTTSWTPSSAASCSKEAKSIASRREGPARRLVCARRRRRTLALRGPHPAWQFATGFGPTTRAASAATSPPQADRRADRPDPAATADPHPLSLYFKDGKAKVQLALARDESCTTSAMPSPSAMQPGHGARCPKRERWA